MNLPSPILILLAFLMAGCSNISQLRLYNGPALDVSQEAIIVLPEEIELIELNKQTVSDSRLSFRAGNIDLRLPSGEHILVLQYKAFWQVDDDNHDTLTSAPITFKVTLNKQEKMTLQLPKLKHYEDAVAFTKHPDLQLVSKRQNIEGSVGTKDNALVFNTIKNQKATEYANLDQLKFWWNRATYYEKTEFLDWQKQANKAP